MNKLRQRKVNVTKSQTINQQQQQQQPQDTNKVKEEQPPPKWKVWILASRPHTLTASIVPVMVSSSLIQHYTHIRSINNNNHHDDGQQLQESYYLGILFASFACLIQLGTNLYNDYSDFVKGADTDARVGQARATQKGWLTPKETLFGSCGCLLFAFGIGSYLTYLSSTWASTSTAAITTTNTTTIDYYMVFVTISSIFNAFCYTGGEYPLGYIGMGHLSIGYSGLGDLFVFLYFGVVATITYPYLVLVQQYYYQSQSHTNNNSVDEQEEENVWKNELMYMSLFASLPIGFLATTIIVVNNLRDRHTDVLVGKNTMAVRFGEWISRLEYMVLMVGSYLLLIPFSSILMKGSNRNHNDNGDGEINMYGNRLWVFLPLLSIPLMMKEMKAVGFGGKDGSELNKHVGGAARIQLLFSLLLMTGLYCSRIF